MEKNSQEQKTGFFAIVGKPNAGKSSLLNSLVGQKVSIVSYKPQTTRNKIMGIWSDGGVQLVFLDTPGFIRPDNLLSEYMHKEISLATEYVDGIIFVVDCTRGIDDKLASKLAQYDKSKLIVALNKIDEGDYQKVYPLIDKVKSIVPNAEIVPISAKTHQNIDVILRACTQLAPVGVHHFEDTQVTDKSMRFLASEIVREKILLYYEDEIPHGISVVVTSFVEKPTAVVIDAEIVCIKDSHKPIIIGHNGDGIKKIGTEARRELKTIVGKSVSLQLFVKVRKDWKDNQNHMGDFGYVH